MHTDPHTRHSDTSNTRHRVRLVANQMYLPSSVLVSWWTVGWRARPFTRKRSRLTDGGRFGFVGRSPTLGMGFLRGATSDTLFWLGSCNLGNDWGFFSRCCSILFWRSSPVSFTLLMFSESLTGGLGSSLASGGLAPTRWEGGGLGNTPWGFLSSVLGFTGNTGFGAAGGSLLRTSPLSDVAGKWPAMWGLA